MSVESLTNFFNNVEIESSIKTVEVYIFFEDEVVMFKRSESKKKFPGYWSIPGGHVEEGETPLSAAVREVQEETGIKVSVEDLELRVVCFHDHPDRNEKYFVHVYSTKLKSKPELPGAGEEGQAHWVKVQEAYKLENVFMPVSYYFDHVLRDKPGIVYNNSQWMNSQLVRVLSETVDVNE